MNQLQRKRIYFFQCLFWGLVMEWVYYYGTCLLSLLLLCPRCFAGYLRKSYPITVSLLPQERKKKNPQTQHISSSFFLMHLNLT